MCYNKTRKKDLRGEDLMFNKDNPKLCAYCAWADKTAGEKMLCYYNGPVAADYKCRRYKYDPYKRNPSRRPDIKPVVIDTKGVV
jgi:hypothetical protein